jgi:hypothetical protein
VAADEVTTQMDALYLGAFLDPDNWLEGSYDSVGAVRELGERRGPSTGRDADRGDGRG